MEIKIKILIFALTITVVSGCPTAPVANNPANDRLAPVRAAPERSNDPASPPFTASLATPTDAYKAFHEYSRRKDIPQLRRALSKEILEFFTAMAKAQNRTLDEELMQLAEKPKAPTAESRNERITGNRALIEFKDERGEWKEMDFVREGGEWKLTLPKAGGP